MATTWTHCSMEAATRPVTRARPLPTSFSKKAPLKPTASGSPRKATSWSSSWMVNWCNWNLHPCCSARMPTLPKTLPRRNLAKPTSKVTRSNCWASWMAPPMATATGSSVPSSSCSTRTRPVPRSTRATTCAVRCTPSTAATRSLASITVKSAAWSSLGRTSRPVRCTCIRPRTPRSPAIRPRRS